MSGNEPCRRTVAILGVTLGVVVVIDIVQLFFDDTNFHDMVDIVSTAGMGVMAVGFILYGRLAGWREEHRHEIVREALKASEDWRRLLAQAVDQSPTGMAVVDREGMVRYANARFSQLCGRGWGETVGLPLALPGRLGEPALAALLDGRLWKGELPIDDEGGGRWLRVAVVPLHQPDGSLPHLAVTLDDTSDVRQWGAALQASEARFRGLIEDSAQGMLVHRHFQPLFANPALATLFGYDSPAAIQALGSIDPLLHPDERARIRGYHEARLEGLSAPREYEFLGVGKDGSVLRLNNRSMRVDWDGKPAVLTVLFEV